MSVYQFGTKADVIPFPGGTGVRPLNQHERSDRDRYVDALDDAIESLKVAQSCEVAIDLSAMVMALETLAGSAIDATEARS
jgi:Skp family chaperone for outer membrane proteins